MEMLQWIGIIVVAMIAGTVIQMSYDRIKSRIQTLLSKEKTKPKQTKLRKFKKGEIIDVSNMSKEDRVKLEGELLMSMQQDIKKARLNAQICEEILKMMESGCPIESIDKQLKISCYYMVRFMTQNQRVKWKKLKHNKKEFVYNKTPDTSATIENYKETTTEQTTENVPVLIPNEREILIDTQLDLFKNGHSLEQIIIKTGKALPPMMKYMTSEQRERYDKIKVEKKYSKINLGNLTEEQQRDLVKKALYAKQKNKTIPQIEKLLNTNIKDLLSIMLIDEKNKWNKA